MTWTPALRRLIWPNTSTLRRAAGLSLSVVILTHVGGAQSTAPTFSKDVAPIVYKHCTSCHRPGGLGPMSLLTFKDVRDAAADILDVVASGIMPPWHADAPHGTFTNDRRLSAKEKETIVAWAKAGAPSGDEKDLPPAPDYPTSWNLGVPDAVFAMPTAYDVPARGTIEYQYFELPTNLSEDKWVQAIEIKPGAREVVHHVLVYARVPAPATPGAGPSAAPNAPRPRPVLVRREDHAPPDSPSGGPPRELGALIAGIAPGGDPWTFPAGTALRLRAGTVLTFQMHYTAHGHAMKDRTEIAFRFAAAPPDEEIRVASFVNGSFVIPAGATDHQVPSEIGFNESVRVWGLFPHTHLRGKRWEYRLVQPNGESSVVLSVPKYDFNWQTYYMFAQPLAIPSGAKIEATAWYDNSTANASNPDAKVDVRWGDQTWEEMQFTAFLYTVDSRRRRGAAPR
jgi:hypothetical protein